MTPLGTSTPLPIGRSNKPPRGAGILVPHWWHQFFVSRCNKSWQDLGANKARPSDWLFCHTRRCHTWVILIADSNEKLPSSPRAKWNRKAMTDSLALIFHVIWWKFSNILVIYGYIPLQFNFRWFDRRLSPITIWSMVVLPIYCHVYSYFESQLGP